VAQWAYEYNNRSKDKPKPQFLIVALQRQHRDEKTWWHGEMCVSIIACAYLLALIVAIKRAPGLSSQRVRCIQCQIIFLTAATNRGRLDIRCPMGCREFHKSKSSNARSTSYSQTPEGKSKKKTQNDKRKGSALSPSPPTSSNFEQQSDVILSYVRFIVGTIERRQIEKEELLALWRWIEERLRQHPFANPAAMVKTLLSDG
jgi:phage FluMu protein Com